jgi:hypothetical protein
VPDGRGCTNDLPSSVILPSTSQHILLNAKMNSQFSHSSAAAVVVVFVVVVPYIVWLTGI